MADDTWLRARTRRAALARILDVDSSMPLVGPEGHDQAQARAGELAVLRILDDVTHSTLRGRFELVIDRGCLPGLSDSQARAQAVTVPRLLAPGGRFVLELLDPERATARGLKPYDAESITAWLGPTLELEDEAPADHGGRCYVLRRRPSE